MSINGGKMPKGHYIFLWGGLVKDAGGMTRVMLDRLCQFKREGLKVTVLLGGRGKEQYDIAEIYQQTGYPEVSRNDFFAIEDWLISKLTTAECIQTEDMNKFLLTSINGNTQDAYFQGNLIGKRYLSEEGNVIKMEFYDMSCNNTKQIVRTDFYYNNKKYKSVKHLSQNERYEYYYADNGFVFMACHFYEGKEKSLKLFNQKEGTVQEYPNISEVREHFFAEYVKEHYTEDLFILCDPILDFEPGFRYMKENSQYKMYKIAINHGIGFAIPRNWNSRCNPRFQRYLDVPSSDLDALVILTNVALENIKKRFGNRNIFKCIPNRVSLNPIRKSISLRNKNKTVFAGRFSEEKQCVHVVKAFYYVVKKYPNAILELYGRGNTEDAIKEEIIKNGLEKNVFIKGFSSNIQDVFSNARLSVVTSEFTFESFCLSLVESLASGCPVVSYEMKFGAAYVLENGHNGFLTKADDIEQLANAIIKIYDMNDDEFEKVSQNAYETAKIFSPERYETNWINLIQEVIEQKNKRTLINEVNITVTDINCSIAENKKNIIKGIMNVKGNIPREAEKLIQITARNYTKDRNDYSYHIGRVSALGENIYEFEICVNNLSMPVGVCFECSNSFVEKDITDVLYKALGI